MLVRCSLTLLPPTSPPLLHSRPLPPPRVGSVFGEYYSSTNAASIAIRILFAIAFAIVVGIGGD